MTEQKTKEKKKNKKVKRGEIFIADLGSDQIGSEQRGLRPVLIIQNNAGNQFAPTVIVASITTKTNKTNLPTHILISKDDSDIKENSLVMLEQIRTIDKSRLREKIGSLGADSMEKIDKAIRVSLHI